MTKTKQTQWLTRSEATRLAETDPEAWREYVDTDPYVTHIIHDEGVGVTSAYTTYNRDGDISTVVVESDKEPKKWRKLLIAGCKRRLADIERGR